MWGSNYENVTNWKREWPLLVAYLNLCIQIPFGTHPRTQNINPITREPAQERSYSRCIPTSILEVSCMRYVIVYCARSPLFVADFVP
jgi:hypothetical protein